MIRKLIITVFAFLSAIPAFANTSRFSTEQAPPALRLMNDSEFAMFLGRLDAGMLRSQVQLKKMDVQSLHLDVQDRQELVRSHERCLQSLDNSREEIQKLLQKQTLKLDLFLLIDLNELARNLDSLDQSLVNTVTASGSSGNRKSLGYARQSWTWMWRLQRTFPRSNTIFLHLPASSTRALINPIVHPQPQTQK